MIAHPCFQNSFLLILWQAAKAGVEIISGGTIGKGFCTQAIQRTGVILTATNKLHFSIVPLFLFGALSWLTLRCDVIMLVVTIARQNENYLYGLRSQLSLGVAPSGPVLFVIVSLFPSITFSNSLPVLLFFLNLYHDFCIRYYVHAFNFPLRS